MAVEDRDMGYSALLKQLALLVKEPPSVKVGFKETATYPDGTPVSLVAAVQEYGSPAQNIPPRPFIRPTVKQNEQQYADMLQRAVVAVLSGAPDADQQMVALGERGKRDIQEAIRRQGLVDTGVLIESVTYEVGE